MEGEGEKERKEAERGTVGGDAGVAGVLLRRHGIEEDGGGAAVEGRDERMGEVSSLLGGFPARYHGYEG